MTIKYVRGADPIIKLLDDDEFTVEVRPGSLIFNGVTLGPRFDDVSKLYLAIIYE